MKLSRRDFLKVSGISAILAALGVSPSEPEAEPVTIEPAHNPKTAELHSTNMTTCITWEIPPNGWKYYSDDVIAKWRDESWAHVQNS